MRNRLTSDGSDYRIWASSGVQLRLQHSWGFISADTSRYDSQERATLRLFMAVLGTLSGGDPCPVTYGITSTATQRIPETGKSDRIRTKAILVHCVRGNRQRVYAIVIELS